MRRRSLLASLAALAASRAASQGYPGLGTASPDWARPNPATHLHFPRDHLPHPAFRTEWWYLTANLVGEDGRLMGAQWTLFRFGVDPADAEAQLWMGHAALTTAETHRATERFARPGQASVEPQGSGISAWIDEWRLDGTPETALNLSAGGADFAYDLAAEATGPIVLQGDRGYSRKSAAGLASHYYSQPFLRLTGEVDAGGGPVRVSGIGWLDREWSSDPLDAGQEGWDWFALTFEDGSKLMAYQLRGTSAWRTGTWVEPDGTARPLPEGAIDVEPLEQAEVAGHRLPVAWRLRLPDPALDLEIRPINRDCWMPLTFSYWEGPVTVTGSRTGLGYLEMTGY